MVGRNRAWLAIMVLGPNARLDDVGRGMPSSPLECTQMDDVGQDMTSSPLESTHSMRHLAWNAIIAVGNHT